jgi:hypothetical protein
MNWTAIGAIGELVGGIAVIGTLIYLATQIRQNTKMHASAIRQSFYDYTTRQMLYGTDDTQFNATLARAVMTNDELPPGERMRMMRLFQAVFVGYQGAYFQHRNKAVSKARPGSGRICPRARRKEPRLCPILIDQSAAGCRCQLCDNRALM